jgi:5-methyltetrahydrofolate corrinoid/iron sulfur protein methyltransferase
MLVIGEKINASNRSVGEAIARRDSDFVANLARAQADAGANFIDLNAGAGKGSGHNETAAIEWLVEVVQATTDKPLTIDSESPDVIEAALRKYNGPTPMINSVTAEKSRLESIGSLAARYQTSLVALAMSETGIPETAEKRLAACETIMTHLIQLGMPAEQVFFDPLVLPISVDSRQGLVTLETVEQIKSRYPAAKTVMGLSNISYGLPERPLINRCFLLMAAYAGLDAAILDPLDTRMMSVIKVADMLTGKDTSRGYLRAHRRGTIVD